MNYSIVINAKVTIIFNHCNTMGRNKIVKCDNCNNQIRSDNLKRHKERCKAKEPTDIFSRQMNENHISNDDVNKFKCSWPTCEKVFKTDYDLQRHMRGHTGEKPYKCPSCNQRFSRLDNMSKHKCKK